MVSPDKFRTGLAIAMAILGLWVAPAQAQESWWMTASTGVGVYARIGTNNFLVDLLPAGLAKRLFHLNRDWPNAHQKSEALCLGGRRSGRAALWPPEPLGVGRRLFASLAGIPMERRVQDQLGDRRRSFPGKQNAGDRSPAEPPHFKTSEFPGDRRNDRQPGLVERPPGFTFESPVRSLWLVQRR